MLSILSCSSLRLFSASCSAKDSVCVHCERERERERGLCVCVCVCGLREKERKKERIVCGLWEREDCVWRERYDKRYEDVWRCESEMIKEERNNNIIKEKVKKKKKKKSIVYEKKEHIVNVPQMKWGNCIIKILLRVCNTYKCLEMI